MDVCFLQKSYGAVLSCRLTVLTVPDNPAGAQGLSVASTMAMAAVCAIIGAVVQRRTVVSPNLLG